MYNSNIPSDMEVPSTSKLIKSTVIAAVVAAVLLVTVVMPSEYGIDPTGVGNVLGLKRMGEIKASLAEESALDAAKNTSKTQAAVQIDEIQANSSKMSTQNHEMTFTLNPDESTELKVTMVRGAKVSYVWETNGGKANFDAHADSTALNIDYHPYYKGSDTRKEGVLTAAFNGSHGWFWRNRTKNPLTITIKTYGEYNEIKRY